MSSDSTNEGEDPHYAYLLLIMFPLLPIEIAVICHQAKTNDVFLTSGRVGPSPFKRIKIVEIFISESLTLEIRFKLPSDGFSTIYMY